MIESKAARLYLYKCIHMRNKKTRERQCALQNIAEHKYFGIFDAIVHDETSLLNTYITDVIISD